MLLFFYSLLISQVVDWPIRYVLFEVLQIRLNISFEKFHQEIIYTQGRI